MEISNAKIWVNEQLVRNYEFVEGTSPLLFNNASGYTGTTNAGSITGAIWSNGLSGFNYDYDISAGLYNEGYRNKNYYIFDGVDDQVNFDPSFLPTGSTERKIVIKFFYKDTREYLFAYGTNSTLQRYDINIGQANGGADRIVRLFCDGAEISWLYNDWVEWKHYTVELIQPNSTLTGMTCFVNGRQLPINNSSNANTPINTGANIGRIGNDVTGGDNYDGIIDSIEVYSDAAGTILVGKWRNENNWLDESGNGANGTIIGEPHRTRFNEVGLPQIINKNWNKYIYHDQSFGGFDTGIQLTTLLNTTNSWSISGWFIWSGGPNNLQALFSVEGTGSALIIKEENGVFRCGYGDIFGGIGWIQRQNNHPLVLYKKYDFEITYDGSRSATGMTITLTDQDGNIYNSNLTNGGFTSVTDNIDSVATAQIGSSNSGSFRWLGIIGEINYNNENRWRGYNNYIDDLGNAGQATINIGTAVNLYIPQKQSNSNLDIFDIDIQRSIFNETNQIAWNLDSNSYISLNWNQIQRNKELGIYLSLNYPESETGNKYILSGVDDNSTLNGFDLFINSSGQSELIMSNDISTNVLRFKGEALSADTFNILNINYNGNSYVSGFTNISNDLEETLITVNDTLTNNIINTNALFIGNRRGISDNTNIQIGAVKISNQDLYRKATRYYNDDYELIFTDPELDLEI